MIDVKTMAVEKLQELCEVKLRGRLSFADNIFEPEKGDIREKGKNAGKQPWRWNFNVLLDKNSPIGVKGKEASHLAIQAAKQLAWPGEEIRIKADKNALRNGDEEKWDGYKDHWYVSCSRWVYNKDGDPEPKRPFKIIDNRRNEDNRFPELTPSDGRPYAGCEVVAIVRFFGIKDEKGGCIISASIEAVQFWAHGTPFGGGRRVDVDKAFDEADEDEMDTKPASTASREADPDTDDLG